jgi:pimeloyl-ACP methyl ester carboxylesterase
MECLVKDIRVYYEEKGDGRPMIMLPGAGPDHRSMSGCMEPVFRQHGGWRRIYLDPPGIGQTRGADWITSSDQMLDIILAFIDAVIPGQHFALVGTSYGAYLARGVAYRKPDLVDGLMLICPVIIADKTQRGVPQKTTLVKDIAFLASLAPTDRKTFEQFSVVQTQRVWERTRDEVLPGLFQADQALFGRIQEQGYAFSFDVNAGSAPFEKPVLILTGHQDHLVGYRDAWQIIEKYPRGTFAVLDRAGHSLPIEQESLFNALAGEWLDRVEESSTMSL